MAEYIDGTEAKSYSEPYMKVMIQKHFGDKVVITEINGKANLVTMSSQTSCILQGFYSQAKK